MVLCFGSVVCFGNVVLCLELFLVGDVLLLILFVFKFGVFGEVGSNLNFVCSLF